MPYVAEGNEWLNDDRKRAEVAWNAGELTIPEGADPENYAAQGILAAPDEGLGRTFQYLKLFGQLNNLYDYKGSGMPDRRDLSNLADTDIVAEGRLLSDFCI